METTRPTLPPAPTVSRTRYPSCGIRWLVAPALGLAVLSGCSLKQEMHPFPREVASLIEQETCDCRQVEIIGNEEGYVLEDGAKKPYLYQRGRMNVKTGINLILDLIMDERPITRVTQRANLRNPFDGKEYVISGLYDGAGTRVSIQLKDATRVGWIRKPGLGTIYKRKYETKSTRWWRGSIEKRKVNGETVWHQYPGGGQLVVSDGSGTETKLFQGAVAGKIMGLDTFDKLRTVIFVPKASHPDHLRNLFLFYYGGMFYETFSNDIARLPDCLDDKSDMRPDECPSDLYVN